MAEETRQKAERMYFLVRTIADLEHLEDILTGASASIRQASEYLGRELENYHAD